MTEDGPKEPALVEPGRAGRKGRLFKKIAIGCIIFLALLAGLIALQPNEFRVVRSAKMAAPAATIFEQVNNFQNWEAWSPWAKLDPDAKNTFEGPAAGQGAIFKWSGNDQVGEGLMTLTESRPHELIRITLEFIRPFPDTSITEFTFQPDGKQTLVTWSMSGQKNFFSKAICLFMGMDMDAMIGGDFEKGLTQIKAIAEKEAESE